MNEITEEKLNKLPFSFFFGDINLPMDTIFTASEKYANNLKDFKILNRLYDIEFKKGNDYECEMSLFYKNKFEFSSTLLLNPLKVDFDDLNLTKKTIFLYSVSQVEQLISLYNSGYKFFDSENNQLSKDKESYKFLNSITIIKKKEFDLESKNNFVNSIKDLNDLLKIINSNAQFDNIEINPILLSFNFEQLFYTNLKNGKFLLILNEDRKNFLGKIQEFTNSKKKFLWIIGSDGIGKTISLMYYSTIFCDNVLYLNLKLLNKNSDKIKEFFINDIIRFFYFKNRNQGIKEFKNTQSNLLYLLSETFHLSEGEKNKENKYKFWIYLKKLINKLSLFILNNSLTIILDQYREPNSDINYEYLNDFIKYINLGHHKIIISSSINNYESAFFSNIKAFDFNPENKETDSDDSETDDKLDDIYDVKEECNFFENILNKKCQNIIKIKNINEKISFDSNFVLNTDYKDETLKLYYSSLVSGKTLINTLSEPEKNCLKNFNYNLKYINKYQKFKQEELINYKNKKMIDTQENKDSLKPKENNIENSEKNNQIKNIDNNDNHKNNDHLENNNQIDNIINNNSYNNTINNNQINANEINNNNFENDKKEGNIISEIIDKFYDKCYTNISEKINGFYLKKEHHETQGIVSIDEFKQLKEMREIIFNQNLISILDFRSKISSFPRKYLNIYQKKILDLESNNNSEIQSFQIDYSNEFCKLTVNKLLNELEKHISSTYDYIKGSGAGINFEDKVIRAFLSNSMVIFGQSNIIKRKVFSLVGKTSNSINTVKKHRDQEKNNSLFEFFGIKEYSDYIDDIDNESDLNKIILTENVYLIAQASKTGRNFDFAILIKISDNEWYLYLLLTTINKDGELKKKSDYINDSVICESYLCELYNIKIKKTFLFFVIPHNYCEDKFIRELENRELYFIYYKSNQFYDKREQLITNLNFPNAELIIRKNNNPDFYLMQIEKSLNAWSNSVNIFLKRKRKGEKLSKYYTRSLSFINGRGIKLNLPATIKNEIFVTLYNNKYLKSREYELLFIGNCEFKNILKVFETKHLLIFFNIYKKYYFYFHDYYEFDGTHFMKMEKPPVKIVKKQKKYPKDINKIDLDKIIEDSYLCFCYNLLGMD